LKVMCNHCGKILDLMICYSLAIEKGGKLTTYHFCSDEHMEAFAQRNAVPLGKG
jgi:hypothetical protein